MKVKITKGKNAMFHSVRLMDSSGSSMVVMGRHRLLKDAKKQQKKYQRMMEL